MVVTPNRVVALDVLRGLAVAGMILVVSPGDWNQAYAPLQHASWNGATLADMVFPAFLFSFGAALGLSFPKDLRNVASRRAFWIKLVRRTLSLILLGLFVEATYVWAISAGAPAPGAGGLSNLRIPGILQRIGLCYLLAGIIAIATARRDENGLTQLRPTAIGGAIVVILIGYWLLLMLVPVPGFGAGQLTPDGSLPAYIDRTIFTEPHLWPLGSATGKRPATYDPEGLLSTLPATANALFGLIAAWVWRRRPDAGLRIGMAAIVLIAAGLALDPFFVINKRIWTSSFALLSSGVSALALVAIAFVSRFRVAEALLTPFRILGAKAILAFVLSTLMSRVAGFSLVPAHDGFITPQEWGFRTASAIAPDPKVASLLCALGVLALVTLVIWPLHRRAIHFRL